jgi:hypothetical protein
MKGRRRIVAALSAAACLALLAVLLAWPKSPSGSPLEAQLRSVIVGFELAKASVRPPSMIGRQLTAADKAELQAGFLARIQRFAAGEELRRWQTWDYPRALLEDEWGTRELTACRGRLVYWDFRHRTVDGGVVVRAGVEQRFSVVKWDAKAGRSLPRDDWVTGVSVREYTLRRSDGAWKVAASRHWMFYDPATGRLETGP